MVTKKNGGVVPMARDPRVLWVPVGCQKCIECRRQKQRNWQVRLSEEIRTNLTGKFVTMTFSTESLIELMKDIGEGLDGYERDNEIVTLAVRRFLERWRKRTGKSVKHWLITELGGGKYEHVHVHGIIWTPVRAKEKDWKKERDAELKDRLDIVNTWKYGFVYIGDYVSEKTVNYITKYVLKTDLKHPEYNPRILTSPGIGDKYVERLDARLNKYKEGKTDEAYKLKNGRKINLPVYYRNKLYSEDERELLWLEKLDKEERYVLGQKISIKGGDMSRYDAALADAQGKNKRLGYGNDAVNWDRRNYERDRRNLKLAERLEKYANDRNSGTIDLHRVQNGGGHKARAEGREKVRRDFAMFEEEMRARKTG